MYITYILSVQTAFYDPYKDLKPVRQLNSAIWTQSFLRKVFTYFMPKMQVCLYLK